MQLRMARARTETLTISGSPTTTATQNSPYAGFTPTTSGGSGGNVFSLSGTLPTGLSFSTSTGAITGTPTGSSSAPTLIITVTDSTGHTASLAGFVITVSPAASALTITDPVANGSPYTNKPPVFRDAFVAMTPLVTQGDEAIDVQGVIGVPYSPMATSIAFTGTDAVWFDKIAGGKLVFLAATRASVPRNGYLTLTVNASNAYGSSETATLSVWVPADADCVFVNFGTGSSANSGTLASPYKYCPGTVDFAGSTYSAAKTIFFDGTTRHETSLLQSYSPPFAAPPHQGTNASTGAVRYAFTGYKGQAKFSGAKTESGAWTAASSADCYGSPDLANIAVMTASSSVARYQPVFWGDIMGRVAQYPRPTNLRKTENAQAAADGANNYNDTLGTADGGMKRLIVTANASDPAAVKLYVSPTGASSYVQDAKLDARFNNASVTYNAAGIGMWLKIWDSGNNISYVNALAYDVTTHRVTFDFGSGSTGSYKTSSGYTAYALVNSPFDVQVETQYAVTGGTKIVAHRPASPGQCYVSRLLMGGGVGHSANVIYHQVWFERYASATSQYGGGLRMYNSQNNTGVAVYGCRFHQMNNEVEEPIGIYGNGATGIDNPIFDRFHHSDNLRGAGSRMDCQVLGRQTGSGPGGYPTKAEVAAHPTGKVRWWFYEEDSVTRSLWFWVKFRGIEFRERCARNFNAVHGDGDAWYLTPGAGLFTDHNYVHGDFADNCLRWKTTSADSGYLTSSQSNWYDGNVVLGDCVTSNVGVSLFSGDPGGYYLSGIYLQSANSTDTQNRPCLAINQGLQNLTVQYSILNGITTNTATLLGTPATWTIDNCGNTGAAFPSNDVANSRYVTNTTTLTAAQTWDGVTIPTAWKAILQAGQTPGTVKIGPFSNWTV